LRFILLTFSALKGASESKLCPSQLSNGTKTSVQTIMSRPSYAPLPTQEPLRAGSAVPLYKHLNLEARCKSGCHPFADRSSCATGLVTIRFPTNSFLL